MKIYCGSDLHIGYEESNYQKINEFFEIVKAEADELILCGDVFDLWRSSMAKITDDKFLDGKPKRAYDALLSTVSKVPTTIIYGNHDYELWKNWNIPIRITDDFVYNKIFFCHGWRFDVQQRPSSFAYRLLVKLLPSIYKEYQEVKKYEKIYEFNREVHKNYFEIKKENPAKHDELAEMTHRVAKLYLQENAKNIECVVMGHTHRPFDNITIPKDPYKEGKLFDCGDMIDSLTYVLIEDWKSKLVKM